MVTAALVLLVMTMTTEANAENDICTSAGVFKFIQTIKINKPTSATLDLTQFRQSINTILAETSNVKQKLQDSIKTRGPLLQQLKDSKIVTGEELKPRLIWHGLGTASKMKGSIDSIQSECLMNGRLPPFTKDTLRNLPKIMEEENISHIFVKPDISDRQITSKITGELIGVIEAAKTSEYANQNFVSYKKKNDNDWAFFPPMEGEQTYICLFDTVGLKTPGFALRLKGVGLSVINKIDKFASFANRLTNTINSIPSSTTLTSNLTPVTDVISPNLLRLVGYSKYLHNIVNWAKFGSRELKLFSTINHVLNTFLSRNKVGTKSLMINLNGSPEMFQPVRSAGSQLSGSLYMRNNTREVKIYSIQSYVDIKDLSILRAKFLVHSNGQYFAVQHSPSKYGCSTGENDIPTCMGIAFDQNDKTLACGSALVVMSTSYDECTRTIDKAYLTDLVPTCSGWTGARIILSSAAITSKIVCPGKTDKIKPINIGITTIPSDCVTQPLTTLTDGSINQWGAVSLNLDDEVSPSPKTIVTPVTVASTQFNTVMQHALDMTASQFKLRELLVLCFGIVCSLIISIICCIYSRHLYKKHCRRNQQAEAPIPLLVQR